jgi:hypothetical protein
MPKRTLRVYPNPYVFIDHEGRPAGAFDMDPVGHNPDAKKIGISGHTSKTIEERHAARGDDRHSLHDLVNQYSAEIQEIPDGDGVRLGASQHARMGILHGSRVKEVRDEKGAVVQRVLELPGALICADQGTADAVGIPFADPMAMLRAARAKAIEDWLANYGEPPAFALEPDSEAHVPTMLRGAHSGEQLQATTQPATPHARRSTAQRETYGSDVSSPHDTRDDHGGK